MIVIREISPDLQWFPEARFGMFIHFGLYSLLGRGEWVMHREHIPRDEYEQLMKNFNPCKFDADQWVAEAERGGCRYMTVTAKHHEGFCLFDSELTDFKITNTSFGRDLIGELIDACHRHNMPIILFYSQPDWHHPNYVHRPGAFKDLQYEHGEDDPDWPRYLEYYHGQVEELCTNYGRIDGIWFDGVHRREDQWQGRRIYELIKEHQPTAVVNDRAGYGDFFTPERRMTAHAAAAGYLVEACQSVCEESWGYSDNGRLYSAQHLLHSLIGAATAGSNYLLNIGPRPDGQMPEQWLERLRVIGEWLQRHGDSIYGTQGVPLRAETPELQYTRHSRHVFLHLLQWPSTNAVELQRLQIAPDSARLLGTDRKLQVSWEEGMAVVEDLPAVPPNPMANVIELTFPSEDVFEPPPSPAPPEIVPCTPDHPARLLPHHASVEGITSKGRPLTYETFEEAETRIVKEPVTVFSTSWRPEQTAEWLIDCQQSGLYALMVELACPDYCAGSRFQVDIAGETFIGQVPDTGGFRDFEQVEVGIIELSAGQHRVKMTPVKLHFAYVLAAVKALILRPVDS